MLLDIVSASFEAAKALRPIRSEELLDEILHNKADEPRKQDKRMELKGANLGVDVKVSWEIDLATENFLIDPKGVLVVERRISGQHFIN